MNGRPWTIEEIARLRALLAEGMAHKDIAQELDRGLDAVRTRCHLVGALRRGTQRRWKRKDDNQLLLLLEAHTPYQEIARKLKRSVKAVSGRARKFDASLTYGNGRPVALVARLLGQGERRVGAWVERGYLVGTPAGTGNHVVVVQDADLDQFLQAEEYWHLWEPERITDACLRAWATEQRGGIHFLTLKEAAAEIGITVDGLKGRIERGAQTAVKSGREWRIRSDWLLVQPEDAHKGAVHRVWSPAERMHLRALYPIVGARQVAGELGRTVAAVTHRIWIERQVSRGQDRTGDVPQVRQRDALSG